MRAIVVIPARYGSTRFPGKPLARLRGRPLVEHVYRRAEKAGNVEQVIVATDDERIMKAVLDFGGYCVMTDQGHHSGSDRLGEVAASHEADVIINVQGDEPLIEPAVIESVIRLHEGKEPPDISTAAYKLRSAEEYRDPGIVKVVVDREGTALYFSRSPIPYGWIPGSGPALGHIGIYAYSRESLLRFVSLPRGELEQIENLEQLRAIENGMRIVVVKFDSFECIGVDRPEDIERAERIMKRMEHRTRSGDSAGIEKGS